MALSNKCMSSGMRAVNKECAILLCTLIRNLMTVCI